MFDEEKFNLDIENLKVDLAMEDIKVTDEDVRLLQRYASNEIDMPQLIDIIKNNTIERIK